MDCVGNLQKKELTIWLENGQETIATSIAVRVK